MRPDSELRSCTRLALALCSAMALTVPAVATAQPWLPLDEGNRWEYVALGGGHQTETITGTITLLSRPLAVKSYLEGTNAGLENFWQTDADENVVLGGFNNTHEGFGLVYDPPVKVFSSPPSVGATWPTHTTAYNLSDMSLFAVIDLTWSTMEDPVLSLPGGNFPTFGVGQVTSATALKSSAGRAFALDGCLVPSTARPAMTNATDWYSAGVGVVQYMSDDLYQLLSYGNPSPVVAQSWGGLKRLYR